MEIQLSEKRIKEAKAQIDGKKEVVAESKAKYDDRKKDLELKRKELDDIVAETEKEEKELAKKSEAAAVVASTRSLHNVSWTYPATRKSSFANTAGASWSMSMW